jgi:hypothetical protein
MRLAAMTLLLFSLTGCGGYVVLDSRTDGSVPPPAPRRVPAPTTCEDGVSRQQAVDIALRAASEQHCRYLQVRDVDHSPNHWKVEITARAGHHERVEIRVKVDRKTGKITSYKEKRTKHAHHDDD